MEWTQFFRFLLDRLATVFGDGDAAGNLDVVARATLAYS